MSQSVGPRLRLLYVGDAALARECLGRPGGSIEIVEAAPRISTKFDRLPTDVRSGVPLSFDILFIEHGYPGVETLAILKDIATRKLHVPSVIVAEWDEELAVLALKFGALDYVIKSKASFRAVLFRLHRLLAHSALLREHSKLGDALAQARHDHPGNAATAAQQYGHRESGLAAKLVEATGARLKAEQQLADRNAALRLAEQHATSERAASQELLRRRAELEAALAQEVSQRRTLETRLAQADASHQMAEGLRLAEAAASAARFSEQQAEFTSSLSQIAQARDALEQQLNAALAAIEEGHQNRADDAAAAAEHVERRESALAVEIARRERIEQQLAEDVASRRALEKQLTDIEATLQRSGQQHASELSDAAARLSESQEKADARLANAAAAAATLEAKLVDAAKALEASERRAAAERQTGIEQAIQRQEEFDARFAEELAKRQALERQLADIEAARLQAEQEYASEIAAATARLAEYQMQAEARLAQGAAAAASRLAEYQKHAEAQMSQASTDAAAALETANQRAAAERQAAVEQAARRQAQFETDLKQEVARRQAIERELADTRAASEQAHRRFLEQVNEMRQRAREDESRLQDGVARERAEWQRTLAEGQDQIRDLHLEGDRARQSLVSLQQEIQRLESAHQEERANFERAQKASEADLVRQRVQYTALEETLEQTRITAQETLERVSTERATECARLEGLVAERDARLRELAARKQAADEAAAKAVAEVEHRLRLTLVAGHRDSRTIAQLQDQLKALGDELEAIRIEADRVPQLRKQIDDMRTEHRRQFDHAPVSMCRYSRHGAVTQVSQALAHLLGYDTTEELKKVDFAATVFESGDELQWIVDRCFAFRATESVETTWKRKDGSRVLVRVLAVASTPDSIDLAAEDITMFRVLEEKLRNSQRMEAVARYASEVAVTCDNLLGRVKQEGQQWLDRIDSDTARYHGELLLDEVTRAARFLRQLAVYGNEQKNAPELVDVSKVLRDLEPVLKRVAGGSIELVLPKPSPPLNLDVEAERLERILVSVAAFGREGMPPAGRLVIEVASVMLDRDFVAKHPNVRPGAHVLLTVSKVKGAVRPDVSAALRKLTGGGNASVSPSDNPGVDLETLQALVSECGGHLWMMAEPPSDMVLKIHLPRRVLDLPDLDAQAKQPGIAGWITRASGIWH